MLPTSQDEGQCGADQNRPKRVEQCAGTERIGEIAAGKRIEQPGNGDRRQRHDLPRHGKAGAWCRLFRLRRASRQALQEMQHEKRRADRREIGEQADEAVAQRRLDRELGQRAAGQRQSAETECDDGRQEQCRPQAPRAGHGDDADGQEQRAFRQDMRRGIEGGVERDAWVAGRQAHAQHGGDHAHLAYAGVGQHRLGIGLRDADRDAVESGEKSQRHQRFARAGHRRVEGQEADQPDDARLDGSAAQHRGGRNGRRRVGERHPAVRRHRPDLEREARDREAKRRVAPRRLRKGRDDVADLHAAVGLAGRERHEAHQQERLAQHGEGHVDTAGTLRCGIVVVMHDQSIGRQADQGEEEIEAQKVGGDEDAETAGQGQQPAHGEARAVRLAAQVGEGIDAGRAPEQRRDAQQDRARPVERQADPELRLIEGEGCPADRQDRRGEAGERRQHQQRRHALAQASRQAGQQQHQRRCQGGDEEPGSQRIGAVHRRATAASGRPICSKSKNPSGAKPSSTAPRARASATPSRRRDAGAFTATLALASAGAITR